MNLKEKIDGLNQMILNGQILEAIELYYADDVVMQENQSPPSVGKLSNIAREKEFVGSIVEWRSSKIKAVTVGENVTMVEWSFDYTHKEWGIRNYSQVAVQTWKDGKIVAERFYYGS